MSRYNRATVSIEPGRIDRASVVPLADNKDRALLTICGREARVVLEMQIDDLWKVATACRDAVKRHEEEERMDALAAEVAAEPVSDMRDFANSLLRGMAR